MYYYIFRFVSFFSMCTLTLGPKRIEVCAKHCIDKTFVGVMIEIMLLMIESDYAMYQLDVIMFRFAKRIKRVTKNSSAWTAEERVKQNNGIRDIIKRMRKFEAKYGI